LGSKDQPPSKIGAQLPESRFDGVFANVSLFHVPSQEMPKVLLELLKKFGSI